MQNAQSARECLTTWSTRGQSTFKCWDPPCSLGQERTRMSTLCPRWGLRNWAQQFNCWLFQGGTQSVHQPTPSDTFFSIFCSSLPHSSNVFVLRFLQIIKAFWTGKHDKNTWILLNPLEPLARPILIFRRVNPFYSVLNLSPCPLCQGSPCPPAPPPLSPPSSASWPLAR